MKQQNKPVIETIINTAAIALTGSGVAMLVNRDIFGLILVGLGAGLEWFKYSKRFK